MDNNASSGRKARATTRKPVKKRSAADDDVESMQHSVSILFI